MRKGGRVL